MFSGSAAANPAVSWDWPWWLCGDCLRARGAKDAKVEATGLWGVEVSSLSFWKVCEGSEIGAIKPVHSGANLFLQRRPGVLMCAAIVG
jgi:hypothetical protein